MTTFDDLEPDERERIRETGEQMCRFAYRYAAAILIAPRPSSRFDGPVRNGTGVLLALGEQKLLATARHVVQSFSDRAAAGEPVLLQVRGAEFDPRDRIAWQDEEADLVLLRVTDDEANQIGTQVHVPTGDWPPPIPPEDSFVLISGFPAIIRQQPGDAEIFHRAMSAFLSVTRIGDNHFHCQFERETWMDFSGTGVPDPGSELGGLSGAPVFLVDQIHYPLVGIATQFLSEYEILRVQGLGTLPTEVT